MVQGLPEQQEATSCHGWSCIELGGTYKGRSSGDSILGPLLFVPFMNDLPDVVQDCSIGLYADDIMQYASHTELSCVKYLGIHIDKDITWKTHVFHLQQSCLTRLVND